MELRQIRYFVTLARRLHFGRAAKELFISQPALSQQIRGLEQELGVELFDRGGRRVGLTAAGEAFLGRAERILGEVGSARTEMEEFAGLMRGRVVIGTIPARALGWIDLPGLLAAFHALHPGIEIVLREDITEELVKRLGSGQVDLALAVQTGIDLPPEVVTKPLFTEDLILMVPAHHTLATRRQVRLAELEHEPFVFRKRGSVNRKLVMRASAAGGFSPRVAFETDEVSTVQALVTQGMGIAVVPRSIAEGAGASVVVLELADLSVDRTISLMWSADRYRPIAAREFLAFAQERLDST